MPEKENAPVRTKRILGITFFDGSADEAVAHATRHGGLIVAPAAPSLVALQYDEEYRRAISDADLAIADSGWMVLLWRIFRRERLTRISGLTFLKRLLDRPDAREFGKIFLVLPSETAKTKTLSWLRTRGFATTADDCYVAPHYEALVEDRTLLELVRARRPAHIVIAVGGGMQDKLGQYLKENLDYRPAIHCIGAALGFLTGDQIPIPNWADRFYVGWFLRLLSQPRIFIPRLWSARELPGLIITFGRNLPPLRKR
jgi:N-acetylglucosaminyldiphosphoundecaprenol N-acetyl-beta-D-mannosaminyltransferase